MCVCCKKWLYVKFVCVKLLYVKFVYVKLLYWSHCMLSLCVLSLCMWSYCTEVIVCYCMYVCVLYVVTEAAGGGEGEARDTESKTRTPHKDVGKN